MIDDYTNEAGVRELERCLNKIIRKIITKYIKASRKIVSVRIRESDLPHYLDKELFINTKPRKITVPGVIRAVACNALGGTTLDIEVSMYKGCGRYTFTGSLGDTIKESIEVALSYIKSNAKEFKINEEVFLNNDFHIHFTESSVQKDGPSAGIAITTAILSLLKNEVISDELTMTGEITLKGEVLKVGGIKEKTIASSRNKIHKIFLPEENIYDTTWLENDLKNEVEFIGVKNYIEIYKKIFS